MSRRMAFAAAAAVLLAMCGCATSRKITTRGELADLWARPITVYAREDRVYRLHPHTLGDSVIRGSGTLTRHGKAESFEGAIPFDQIVAVKTDSRSVMKGLALVGITAIFAAYAGEATTNDGLVATDDLRYVPPPSPPGGGGFSCPHVYAWDGERYMLEAEPFGTAWGKAFELTTQHLLPAARAEEGVVRLRLANERDETHYVDAIGLQAIHLGASMGAVLDGEGRAWPLSHPTSPSAAHDEEGRDILPRLAAADGRMWECEASSLTPGSGYEDVLEVAFARPRHASTGSLVLTATNTDLWAAVYGHVRRVVGDQTAVLAHAIETDRELIATLRDYLRDAALQVQIWNGSGWETAGAFQPEASAVTFTRALRVHIPDAAGETVRVRLRSLADVWKIDAIAAEWGDAHPLPMSPVEMRTAIGPSGEDLRDALGTADGRHAVLLQPDRVELTFAAARPAEGGRVVYAVSGRGYLHPWETPVADAGTAALPVPAERRVEYLKEILKHRELALEPVYEAWRATRVR